MTKTIRAALYWRASSGDRTIDHQHRELRAVALQRGWEVTAIYTDTDAGDPNHRDDRPGLEAMLEGAMAGNFDVVMCWTVDRLGRSLADLLGIMEDLHGTETDLFLHQQAFDATTPADRAVFATAGIFAGFGRSITRSRVRAGMERARDETPEQRRWKGKRAIGRPRITNEVYAAVVARLEAGTGILKTARLLGIGTGTVQRIQRARLTT